MILFPQAAAYGALAIWAMRNRRVLKRLGLDWTASHQGLQWGIPVGLALGAVNLSLILHVIPAFGWDILFLRETPHARLPVWMMLPAGIAIIGVLVELNFRGFQLGRLLVLFGDSSAGRIGALVLSACVFAWDPFMVAVFRHLHWIALWDGLIWGVLFLRTQSLYATIAAHIVEVCILYAGLKLWFA